MQSLLITAMVLLLGLVIFSVYQGQSISKKKTTIRAQLDSLNNLQLALSEEQANRRNIERENANLSQKNRKLEAETKRLNIEIDRLENEILALKATIRRQRKTMRKIESSIAEKEVQLFALQSEMDSLVAIGMGNDPRIAELTGMQSELTTSIDSLGLQSDSLLLTQDSLVYRMIDKEEEEYYYKTQIEIIDNAEVSFSLIAPRKTAGGSEIRRVKKNNWHHTQIELSLYHEDMEILAEQEFVVKIIDNDTKKPVPLRESNPEFPDSEDNAVGLYFTFLSNPIELSHINTEDKTGQNYELQVFLLQDDRELLMRNGMIDFIKNGKVEKIGF
ncbi:MAG: hypothetical protein AAFV80_09090 [Bacteroidota bacterium]